MSRPARRAALAAIVVALAGLAAPPGRALRADAIAAFDPDPAATPAALMRPLWADLPAARVTGARAETALRIVRRAQRRGVLRAVTGPRPARVVALGELQDGGKRIGVTMLLALPSARRNVRAIVPGGLTGPGAARRLLQVRFTAPVVRDVVVDVDLRRGAIVAVTPGPASRTSTWTASRPTPTPAASALRPALGAPALVRLSPRGPAFAAYDGTPALATTGRDWPVSLVFTGHANVGSVKQALRSAGFGHVGERRWLAYGATRGAVRLDSDRGLKTACDANGTDIHLRLYAPPASDHFIDPRFGSVVVATAHLDRGEGCTTPPRLFGFSQQAEHRVADALAGRLGWRVRHDALALGNAEPFRRDLAAPDHVWWSDGRATLIRVP